MPLLDPIDDMGIKDQGLKKVIQKVEAFEHRMYSHPLHNDPNLETVYKLCEKKAQVKIQSKPLYLYLTEERDSNSSLLTHFSFYLQSPNNPF